MHHCPDKHLPGEEMVLPRFLHRSVSNTRLQLRLRLAHVDLCPKHTRIRRVFYHRMRSYPIRRTMDLPLSCVLRVRFIIQNDQIEGEGCDVDSDWKADDLGPNPAFSFLWRQLTRRLD